MTPNFIDWVIIAMVPLVAFILSSKCAPTNWRNYYLFSGNLRPLNFTSLYFGANVTFTSIFVILSNESFKRGSIVYCIPIFFAIGSLLFYFLYDKFDLFFQRDITLHNAAGEIFESKDITRLSGKWTILAFVGTVALEFYGAVTLMGWMNLPLFQSVTLSILVAMICGTFTVKGGLRGAAKANVFLDILTVISVMILLYFSVTTYFPAAPAGTQASRAIHNIFSWDNLIFAIGMMIIFVPFQLCTLDTWQRSIASKHSPNRRRNMLFNGLFVSLVFCLPITLGILAKSLPSASPASPLHGILEYFHIPNIAIGLLVAGFIAAIISTADSLLNCCSYSLLFDVLGIDPEAVDADPEINRKVMASAKFYTVIFSFIAGLISVLCYRYSDQLSQMAIAIFSAQIVFLIPIIFILRGKPAGSWQKSAALATKFGFLTSIGFVIASWWFANTELADAGPLAGLIISTIVLFGGRLRKIKV